MFDRSNIIHEQDLARAVAKRFGKRRANMPACRDDAEEGKLVPHKDLTR
jgi:hypothetical protein